MSQIGERLRLTRESQGISLAQAAVETRILQRYIVALEEGDFQHLPGDVYARGFIRNYALYLGMPAEELIELYRLERGTTDPIRVVPATSSPRIRGLVIPSFFGVFFVVLVLVGMSYLVLNAMGRVGENPSLAAQSTPTSAPAPSPLPTFRPNATSIPVIASGPTSAAPAATAEPGLPAGGAASVTSVPTPAQAAPIEFEVRIDSGENPGSWLEIKADGQSIFRKVLGPGQSFRNSAQRTLSIRAGNASVVTVMVSGQQPQRLGSIPGEVQTFTWPP
jgi:cytoskeletal protein RodZ